MSETEPQDIVEYQTADGISPFSEWIDSLRDRNARVRIRVRLDRLTLGNFGDTKAIGGGIHELRIDRGPG